MERSTGSAFCPDDAIQLAREVVSSSGAVRNVAKSDLGRMVRSRKPEVRRRGESGIVWIIKNAGSRGSGRFNPVNWATELLDGQIVRPLLQTPRWRSRCQLIRKLWGYDLLDEATGYVWTRIAGFSDQGQGVRGWCAVVLENYFNTLLAKYYANRNKYNGRGTYVDLAQAEVEESKAHGSDVVPLLNVNTSDKPYRRARPRRPRLSEKSLLTFALATVAAAEGPLPPKDLAAVEMWDPVDGLILGVLSGLWPKIPQQTRDRWCREGLVGSPFPGDQIIAAPRTRQRLLLAEAVSRGRDTIDQRWKRGKDLLAALGCVQAATKVAEKILAGRRGTQVSA